MELLHSISFTFVIIHLTLSDYNVQSTSTESVAAVKTADRVVIYDHKNFIAVHCDVKPIEEQDYPVSDKNFTQLFVQFCDPPKESYASVLLEHKYNVENIRELTMDQTPYDSVLKGKHLDGLNLTEVNIRGVSTNKLVRMNTDFLEAASNVQSMHLENVVLAPMPATTKAVAIIVNFGRFEGPWEGCENLQYLIFSQVEVPDIKNWLSKCTNLQNIILNRMPLVHSLRWVLEGATAVTDVVITDCDVKWLTTDLFSTTGNVKNLKLTNNKINYLERFANMTKLEKLNLALNPLIDGAWNMKVISALPALHTLDLTGVHLPNFCNHFNKSKKINKTIDELDETVEPFNVTLLNLEGAGITKICFANWPSLSYLNLHRNNISVLEVNQLPINKTGNIIVNLYDNPVRHVVFDEHDYEFLNARSNLTRLVIAMNFTLDCDCHGAWLARAARRDVVTALQAGCSDGTAVSAVPPEQVECDKFLCEGCTCRRSWSDNMTRADCAARALHAMPRVPALKQMSASNNLIETIRVEDLPETLLFLGLQNNRVARLDEATAAALFASPERRVRLSGNPIICDCDNKPFLEALKNHKIQVEDYNNVTCAGDGTSMDDVDFEALCSTKKIFLTALLAASGMLIGLTALISALYFRYGQSIKIFLYARGICLCCMVEDELDAEREYDAFVSFSHEDEKFVNEELLPDLEKEYKICIHYRDWAVGDMIPAQITRSVENSRRTIIVLSKKFVKSLWGLLEFRTAHVSALSEGRVRVIVVVIDDVTKDDTLDLQLRGYLLTNTYLKWGDPWFWDKLKYAMPHKGIGDKDLASRHPSRSFNMNGSNVLRMDINELPALPSPNAYNVSLASS